MTATGKKVSIIVLSILLLVTIILLFYWIFKKPKKSTDSSKLDSNNNSSGGGLDNSSSSNNSSNNNSSNNVVIANNIKSVSNNLGEGDNVNVKSDKVVVTGRAGLPSSMSGNYYVYFWKNDDFVIQYNGKNIFEGVYSNGGKKITPDDGFGTKTYETSSVWGNIRDIVVDIYKTSSSQVGVSSVDWNGLAKAINDFKSPTARVSGDQVIVDLIKPDNTSGGNISFLQSGRFYGKYNKGGTGASPVYRTARGQFSNGGTTIKVENICKPGTWYGSNCVDREKTFTNSNIISNVNSLAVYIKELNSNS